MTIVRDILRAAAGGGGGGGGGTTVQTAASMTAAIALGLSDGDLVDIATIPGLCRQKDQLGYPVPAFLWGDGNGVWGKDVYILLPERNNANDSKVATWTSLGQAGGSFANATEAEQPLEKTALASNRGNAVLWDGTDDYLIGSSEIEAKFNASPGCTIAWVWQPVSTSGVVYTGLNVATSLGNDLHRVLQYRDGTAQYFGERDLNDVGTLRTTYNIVAAGTTYTEVMSSWRYSGITGQGIYISERNETVALAYDGYASTWNTSPYNATDPDFALLGNRYVSGVPDVGKFGDFYMWTMWVTEPLDNAESWIMRAFLKELHFGAV